MVKGYYPKTIAEALSYKADHEKALLIAGGTDVMVVKKPASEIIFLNQIAQMKEVRDEGDYLSIGAGCCYTDLLQNELVPEVLKLSMRKIASPAVRSAGTLVGNICNASPAGDSLPVLYALNATVVVASSTGTEICERRIPIDEFILGIRKIALNDNEMVVAVEIQKEDYNEFSKIYYEKVGARQSEAISKLSFVGLYRHKDDMISDIRIAFGSVGITVVRLKELEKEMLGRKLSEIDDWKTSVIDAYMDQIHPIDDQRSTAEYRSTICRNLLTDFLRAD